MILPNYYMKFNPGLPIPLCKSIMQEGLNKNIEKGGIDMKNKDNPQANVKLDVRDSEVGWLNDPWIYKEINPYLKKANEETGWDFQYEYLECCQFTIYKPGQYYGWHVDQFPKPYDDTVNPNIAGRIRKISMSVLLNSPNDFVGGELEFDIRGTGGSRLETIDLNSQGSMVFFPSFVWHQVKPVTSGTRYSLVMWVIGRPFK